MTDALVGLEGWEHTVDVTFVSSFGELFRRTVNGSIEVALKTTEAHRNVSGIVHGGALMALLDRVMGANSRHAIGESVVTATMMVNFLYPVQIGSVVFTSCRLSKVGRRAIFADAEARAGGRLVATANATYIRPGRRTVAED